MKLSIHAGLMPVHHHQHLLFVDRFVPKTRCPIPELLRLCELSAEPHDELAFPCAPLLHQTIKRIWAFDASCIEDPSARPRFHVPLHEGRLLHCSLTCTMSCLCESRCVMRPRWLVDSSSVVAAACLPAHELLERECMPCHGSRGFIASASLWTLDEALALPFCV